MASEALLQAEAEGLTLESSDNKAGFKGVSVDKGKPRQLEHRGDVPSK